MLYKTALCLLAASASASVEWEWSEAFAVADASHTWIMQKVGGAYADATMVLVVIPTTDATKENVDVLKATADTLSDGACPTTNPGTTMSVPAGGGCYTLAVNDALDDSTWPMATAGYTGLAMYAQHVPTEFERDMHYFKDSAGEDIEPIPYSKRWGAAILAAVIVMIVTFTGLLLMIPGISTIFKKYPDQFAALANSFAAGALIAAAFYLLLYEGSHYVAVKDANGRLQESSTSFLWGTMVLLGVIAASIFDLIVTAVRGGAEEEAPKKDVEGASVADGAVATKQKQTRVLSSVLIGDFMHNLCDGFFIGTAFTACSTSLGWNITVATVAHELAQELSDYIVLTDPLQGNLTPVKALAFNFISGTSVLIGVIIMMSMSEFSNSALGCILTFGGGVYIQIGLAECLARVYASPSTVLVKAASIVTFCLGALCIGLVLLDHKHCEAGGAHDHGGH